MTAVVATTDSAFVANLPETIRTARLVLRAPNRSDVAAMARLANNQNIFKWLARLPNPYRQSDAVEFVETIARSQNEHAFSILTDDGGFIGTIGFHLDPEEPTEIGYWIGEPYWGLGYGSEAVAAVVDAADAAGCDRIAARAQSDNHSSCRVLEKSGFVETSRRIADCGPHKGRAITYFRRDRLR